MAHLYFMILQHVCLRLVVEPTSKTGFVKETLRVGHSALSWAGDSPVRSEKRPPGLDSLTYGKGGLDAVETVRRPRTRPHSLL